MIKTIHHPVILIDGSFYIYKAYHAFPPLVTSTGKPVWVVYGFINMIKSLLTRYQPIHIAIIFDAVGKTFRDDLFDKYKANRSNTPKDLYNQMDLLYEIIKAMGIPILNIPYVEADDVIATLAIFYSKTGKTVLISTGDKDMAQIVSSQITLINTVSNILYDPKTIEKKFGVPPILIADYLALTGDRSDNIPGVPGIGKKIAQTLLTNIGNLKTLYENLDNILTLNIRGAKTIQNKLITHKKEAWLSYKLTSIKIDVPLKKTDYALSIPKINIQHLLILFKKYEFNHWLLELKSGSWLNKYEYINNTPLNQQKNHLILNQTQHSTQDNYKKFKKNNNHIMYNIDTLYQWISQIHTNDLLIFNIFSDTHNTSSVFNISSFCLFKITEHLTTQMLYIPIQTNTTHNYNKISFHFKEILIILQPILENSKIKKIGQNMKFHFSLLQHYNINLSGINFDVLLALYVLYGTVNHQNMKRFLDINIFNTILNFRKTINNYNNSHCYSNSRNIQLESSCSADLMYSIFHLYQILLPKIKENSNLKTIFEEIEMPLISILTRIENYGVLIDKDLLHAHATELNYRLNELQQEVYRLVNIPFNLNSTKQLQEILYNQQKLPIFKKTPNGAPSTSEEVLKRLAKKYPVPKIILKYRGLSKLKSTYTNKLISMINKKSKRVHTSYNQTRTSTGRLSSANPNLQNIPNRHYYGRKIRQAFIAPSNFSIVSADYSQIELRIMAHLSHDFKLINDFLSGKDIHTTTASEIFVTALHLVTNEQRHHAKTINFGLIYGMSAFGLSQQLSVTCREAQKYVNRYFQRYPGVMQYMQHIKNNVIKHGYVSTLNGRKLYLPNIYSDNIAQKQSAERAAINAPMQGSAADIIKKAMISIDNWIQTNNIPAHMIMQVHDELVFEVQNNFLDIVIKQIKKLMEECCILDIPLKVDIGVGKNWEQAH